MKIITISRKFGSGEKELGSVWWIILVTITMIVISSLRLYKIVEWIAIMLKMH